VYAVTGTVAKGVGGIAWLPFLIAFAVATITAFSYLELVTKYPRAAGAALYTHKAFGVHFVTFLVAFTVVCSGITSASTSSNLLAANLLAGLDRVVGGVPTSTTATLLVALAFMLLLALVNLRGVGESVKFNVVLTLVEITALAIVIGLGFWAMATSGADVGQLVVFESASDRGIFGAVTIATAVAFFAMVGFEDSVNMVEECERPERIFPRAMLTGLGIAVLIYMLVAVSVVMVLPLGDIRDFEGETGILLEVVKVGAPGLPVESIFPFLTVFAVANTALINMLMASRLIYGMARQDVLPRSLGKVLPGRLTPWAAIVFTTLLAFGLISAVALGSGTSVVTSPQRNDRSAAAVRVHDRQRRLSGGSARSRARGHLPGTHPAPGRRGTGLRLPGRPLGPRPGQLGAVRDRGLPARHRHRPVAADVADEPQPARQAHRLPRPRAPRQGLRRVGDSPRGPHELPSTHRRRRATRLLNLTKGEVT
jgi:amino acid transporter